MMISFIFQLSSNGAPAKAREHSGSNTKNENCAMPFSFQKWKLVRL